MSDQDDSDDDSDSYGDDEEEDQTSESADLKPSDILKAAAAANAAEELALESLKRNIQRKPHLPLQADPIEEEKLLQQFWDDAEIPPPPPAAMPHLAISSQETLDYRLAFTDEAKSLGLQVSKVPQEAIDQQRKQLEETLFKEQVLQMTAAKKREADVVFREHLARERIKKLEAESTERLRIEKEKLSEAMSIREVRLGESFRVAKENLESDIKAQGALIKEKYGDLNLEHEPYSRQYVVKKNNLPTTIEARIHCLRAVKTKLKKGAYVILLTMCDRLGGTTIAWTGGADDEYLPDVTNPVTHQGRYFDRVMKVEESVFAVCPAKQQLNPSYTLLFELFELKSQYCHSDRALAWAAMPMTNEHFAVVSGKFRLPFLRGQHGPLVQHYKAIEESIAEDLNTWLCNMYVEIRHVSRDSTISRPLKSAYGLNFIAKTISVTQPAAELYEEDTVRRLTCI